jgi:hypothetical protein
MALLLAAAGDPSSDKGLAGRNRNRRSAREVGGVLAPRPVAGYVQSGEVFRPDLFYRSLNVAEPGRISLAGQVLIAGTGTDASASAISHPSDTIATHRGKGNGQWAMGNGREADNRDQDCISIPVETDFVRGSRTCIFHSPDLGLARGE